MRGEMITWVHVLQVIAQPLLDGSELGSWFILIFHLTGEGSPFHQ